MKSIKEKLKEALNSDYTDYEVVRWIKQNFPELAESEDERIGKELIEFVKSRGGFKQEYIAWIEEQANHANFRNGIKIGDKVTRNENGVLVNLSQLKRVAKKDEKQGEQKLADKVEPKFKVGDVIKRGKSTLEVGGINTERQFYELRTREHIVVNTVPFSEQGLWKLLRREPSKILKGTTEDEDVRNFLIGYFKLIDADSEWGLEKETKDRILFWLQNPQCMVPAEAKEAMYDKPAWSEEDEMFVHGLIRGLAAKRDIHGHATFSSDCIDITETIYWLESLKDKALPQPKQEWSEEDERMLNDIIRCGEHHCYLDAGNIAWLKSIAPPYYCDNCKLKKSIQGWKPSDVQMEALESATENCAYSEYQDCLRELIEQLKKLK